MEMLMTRVSDERFPRRAKADFTLKLKSEGIKKYRHISNFNPGTYILSVSLDVNKFGLSETV